MNSITSSSSFVGNWCIMKCDSRKTICLVFTLFIAGVISSAIGHAKKNDSAINAGIIVSGIAVFLLIFGLFVCCVVDQIDKCKTRGRGLRKIELIES